MSHLVDSSTVLALVTKTINQWQTQFQTQIKQTLRGENNNNKFTESSIFLHKLPSILQTLQDYGCITSNTYSEQLLWAAEQCKNYNQLQCALICYKNYIELNNHSTENYHKSTESRYFAIECEFSLIQLNDPKLILTNSIQTIKQLCVQLQQTIETISNNEAYAYLIYNGCVLLLKLYEFICNNPVTNSQNEIFQFFSLYLNYAILALESQAMFQTTKYIDFRIHLYIVSANNYFLLQDINIALRVITRAKVQLQLLYDIEAVQQPIPIEITEKLKQNSLKLDRELAKYKYYTTTTIINETYDISSIINSLSASKRRILQRFADEKKLPPKPVEKPISSNSDNLENTTLNSGKKSSRKSHKSTTHQLAETHNEINSTSTENKKISNNWCDDNKAEKLIQYGVIELKKQIDSLNSETINNIARLAKLAFTYGCYDEFSDLLELYNANYNHDKNDNSINSTLSIEMNLLSSIYPLRYDTSSSSSSSSSNSLSHCENVTLAIHSGLDTNIWSNGQLDKDLLLDSALYLWQYSLQTHLNSIKKQSLNDTNSGNTSNRVMNLEHQNETKSNDTDREMELKQKQDELIDTCILTLYTIYQLFCSLEIEDFVLFSTVTQELLNLLEIRHNNDDLHTCLQILSQSLLVIRNLRSTVTLTQHTIHSITAEYWAKTNNTEQLSRFNTILPYVQTDYTSKYYAIQLQLGLSKYIHLAETHYNKKIIQIQQKQSLTATYKKQLPVFQAPNYSIKSENEILNEIGDNLYEKCLFYMEIAKLRPSLVEKEKIFNEIINIIQQLHNQEDKLLQSIQYQYNMDSRSYISNNNHDDDHFIVKYSEHTNGPIHNKSLKKIIAPKLVNRTHNSITLINPLLDNEYIADNDITSVIYYGKASNTGIDVSIHNIECSGLGVIIPINTSHTIKQLKSNTNYVFAIQLLNSQGQSIHHNLSQTTKPISTIFPLPLEYLYGNFTVFLRQLGTVKSENHDPNNIQFHYSTLINKTTEQCLKPFLLSKTSTDSSYNFHMYIGHISPSILNYDLLNTAPLPLIYCIIKNLHIQTDLIQYKPVKQGDLQTKTASLNEIHLFSMLNPLLLALQCSELLTHNNHNLYIILTTIERIYNLISSYTSGGLQSKHGHLLLPCLLTLFHSMNRIRNNNSYYNLPHSFHRINARIIQQLIEIYIETNEIEAAKLIINKFISTQTIFYNEITKKYTEAHTVYSEKLKNWQNYIKICEEDQKQLEQLQLKHKTEQEKLEKQMKSSSHSKKNEKTKLTSGQNSRTSPIASARGNIASNTSASIDMNTSTSITTALASEEKFTLPIRQQPESVGNMPHPTEFYTEIMEETSLIEYLLAKAEFQTLANELTAIQFNRNISKEPVNTEFNNTISTTISNKPNSGRNKKRIKKKKQIIIQLLTL